MNYNIQSKKLYATKNPRARKLTNSRLKEPLFHNKKVIVERYCSMCGKAGHTKRNCPKVCEAEHFMSKKTKKINNISSTQYEYIEQSQSEDDIEYINNESD